MLTIPILAGPPARESPFTWWIRHQHMLLERVCKKCSECKTYVVYPRGGRRPLDDFNSNKGVTCREFVGLLVVDDTFLPYTDIVPSVPFPGTISLPLWS